VAEAGALLVAVAPATVAMVTCGETDGSWRGVVSSGTGEVACDLGSVVAVATVPPLAPGEADVGAMALPLQADSTITRLVRKIVLRIFLGMKARAGVAECESPLGKVTPLPPGCSPAERSREQAATVGHSLTA
jgi:hypothetical protein